MKCVDLKTFMRLPPGILYTTYLYPAMISLTSELPRLESLYIKGPTLEDTWTFTRVLPDFVDCYDRLDIIASMRCAGESPDLNFEEEEDGCGRDLPGEIAVLEKRDVVALLQRISGCLPACERNLDFGYPPGVQEMTQDYFGDF